MKPEVYRKRREALMAQVGEDGIALLPSSREFRRNGDVDFPFRQESHLLYLTGFGEPQSIAVLRPGDEAPFRLFVRERDPAQELWLGTRAGLEGAKSDFGADDSAAITAFEEKLPELLRGRKRLFHRPGIDPAFDAVVERVLGELRAKTRDGVQVPALTEDLGATVAEMRLFKDEHELEVMRRSAQITAEAHCAAMRCARPGLNEGELQAVVEYVFRRRGAQSVGYGSIVAGGNNACVLHYVTNDQVIDDGALILIDAGCELDGYSADITRTFPASGKFSPEQRDLYQAVLDAQLASIEKSRAGVRFSEVHDVSVRILTERLIELGLLKGSVDEAIETESYKRYYPHKTGHWLGMDVHDCGQYFESEGVTRKLRAGMVMTIEPGLYVRADDEEAPERFRGIGIRIEDDVVITAGEPEILTADAPKEIAAIEALMAEAAELPL
ncbi:MAG: aminopeptidase P N-terminal domain-containing protein [Deltaproteobacteria bacterium]|nr:aminopeptidase P N-terminal domain-containing protein [Deltaproteobacteria bacterium]